MGCSGWDGAAARLGLSSTTLISRMQRLGISAVTGLRKSASGGQRINDTRQRRAEGGTLRWVCLHR
jgi:hypothetical protein